MKKNRLYIAQKLLGLFSAVRGYNLLFFFLAYYFSAMFVLSGFPLKKTLYDTNLLCLACASLFAIAGGYIINDFYDTEKDWINKPIKTMMIHWVGNSTKLTLYFILNFCSVGLAVWVSLQQFIFFSGYLFLLWSYSHKMKKKVIIGNVFSSILSVIPFFALLLYYNNFQKVIFVHAMFLWLLVLLASLLKDIVNIQGDLLCQYATIPTIYGENWAKKSVWLIILLSFIPVLLLLFYFPVGKMAYYFLFSQSLLVFLGGFVLQNKKNSQLLYNLLKINIVFGVFSLLFL